MTKLSSMVMYRPQSMPVATCSERYAANLSKPALSRARHIDYESRPTEYACYLNDEECRAAPLHAAEGVSGEVRRRLQALTNMLSCSRRAMCAAKCIHSHEKRQCPMMHLDASISAASNTSVVLSQQRAFKAGKGHTELVRSQAVFKGKSTAALALT